MQPSSGLRDEAKAATRNKRKRRKRVQLREFATSSWKSEQHPKWSEKERGVPCTRVGLAVSCGRPRSSHLCERETAGGVNTHTALNSGASCPNGVMKVVAVEFRSAGVTTKPGSGERTIGGSVSPAEFKVYEYLVETPAGTQTPEALQEFVKEVKVFKLTEAERLQSVNLRPATAVEVHLIVEDCDERLSSEQVDALVETVDRILPTPPEKPEAEGEEAVEGDEEEGEEETEDMAEGETAAS